MHKRYFPVMLLVIMALLVISLATCAGQYAEGAPAATGEITPIPAEGQEALGSIEQAMLELSGVDHLMGCA